MNELQEKLLELMVETDEICQKHGIEYVLFAGTALGAQRHGGFIPWDDDADIIMTLPNYEKFISVVKDELKPGRAVDFLEMDTDYILTYGRYVNTDTTAIQRHTLFGGCHPGVKLDIFCVVPTFDDPELIEKHRTDILAFSEVVCDTGRMMTYRPEGFYKRYREELAKMEAQGRKEYIQQNLRELTHRVEAKTKNCILFSGMASNTKLYDASIFDEIVYVPFENTQLPISVKNELFSEQHMGRDWMALPANITEPRHQFLLDVDRPYTEYVQKLEKELDMDKAKEACILKKEHNLYEKDVFRDVLANGQAIRNAQAEIETKKRLGSGQDDAFEPFLRAQLSRDSKVHKLAVNITDDEFDKIIKSLLMKGRYYDAESVINTWINAGRLKGDSDRVQKVFEVTSLCRDIMRGMYLEKDPKNVKELLEKTSDFEDNPFFLQSRTWLKLQDAENETAEIEKSLDEGIGKFGEIAELIFQKGLCRERAGDSEGAVKQFEKAMETIRDGFAYQEMVNRGISSDILFESAAERDSKATKVKISAVMKGKANKALVKKADEEGCRSLHNKTRYLKHVMWKKSNKDKSEEAFRRYSDKLFGAKI